MATTEPGLRSIDLPVAGMDCADCVAPIEQALRRLPW